MDLKEDLKEEDTTDNQAVLDMDLKMKDYKNNMGRDVTQDLQMKLADVLIVKRDKQITNKMTWMCHFMCRRMPWKTFSL